MSTLNNLFGSISDTTDRGTFFERVVLDTGVYPATITNATLAHSSTSAAKGLNVTFDVNGVTFYETFWILNKVGKATYRNKNGKDVMLGGARTVDDLCIILNGTRIGTLGFVEKTIPIEVDGSTQLINEAVAEDLIGKAFQAGITKVCKNKQEKTNAGYVDTNDKIYNNILSLAANVKGQTADEVLDNAEPKALARWAEKHTGTVKDNFTPVVGTQSSVGATTPTSSVNF